MARRHRTAPRAKAVAARAKGTGPRGLRSIRVIADESKKEVAALLRKLEPWLRARVETLVVERDVRAFYKEHTAAGTAASSPCDAIVVLGGDGAILAAVRAFANTPVPTLGINFGRVGFLASVEARDWREALAELLAGQLVREPRMRLDAHLERGSSESSRGEKVNAVALNDVVLTRGAFQGMLTLSLSVGRDWVTNYRADGLIVATPSGSTAYSLAAGGPLLAPTMEGLVVTPVCPQALSHRAIVLGAADELSLTVEEASGVTTLVVDGQGFYPVRQGDRVRLRRHPVPWPLLARPGHDPFRRWRDRLGWRGSLEETDAMTNRAVLERADPEHGSGL